jgi:hypothetical protein
VGREEVVKRLLVVPQVLGMDVDLSDEEQMMRAIAMSLGESVIMSTDQVQTQPPMPDTPPPILSSEKSRFEINCSTQMYPRFLNKVQWKSPSLFK